jgi:hypothetical protein
MQTKKAAPAPRPEGLEDSWLSFLLPECLRPRRTPARALTADGWVEARELEALERVGILIEVDGSLDSLCLLGQALTGWDELGSLPPDDRIGIMVSGAQKETCLIQALMLNSASERGWNTKAEGLFHKNLNTNLILSMFWNRNQDLPPASIEIWGAPLDFPPEAGLKKPKPAYRHRYPLAEQGMTSERVRNWLKLHAPFSAVEGLYDF